MDREAWRAAVHGVARVWHYWVTELNWTDWWGLCFFHFLTVRNNAAEDIYAQVFIGHLSSFCGVHTGSPGGTTVKEPACHAGDARDRASISGSGRYPGDGDDIPLQYSCLENLMDREAWWATVHRVTKSRTWVKLLSTHAYLEVELLGHVGTLCLTFWETDWLFSK